MTTGDSTAPTVSEKRSEDEGLPQRATRRRERTLPPQLYKKKNQPPASDALSRSKQTNVAAPHLEPRIPQMSAIPQATQHPVIQQPAEQPGASQPMLPPAPQPAKIADEKVYGTSNCLSRSEETQALIHMTKEDHVNNPTSISPSLPSTRTPTPAQAPLRMWQAQPRHHVQQQYRGKPQLQRYGSSGNPLVLAFGSFAGSAAAPSQSVPSIAVLPSESSTKMVPDPLSAQPTRPKRSVGAPTAGVGKRPGDQHSPNQPEILPQSNQPQTQQPVSSAGKARGGPMQAFHRAIKGAVGAPPLAPMPVPTFAYTSHPPRQQRKFSSRGVVSTSSHQLQQQRHGPPAPIPTGTTTTSAPTMVWRKTQREQPSSGQPTHQ